MTPCAQLTERMPDVALGRGRWTADEQRHLAACVDCRAEFELVVAVAELDAPASALPDPQATATRVLQRLRAHRLERRSRRRIWAAAGLAAAAVAVFAVWTARGTGGSTGISGAPPSRVATAHLPMRDSIPLATRSGGMSTPDFPLPELDSLSVDALDSVLHVLDEPLARAAAWKMPDLGDPGDQELERAFTGKEG